MITRDTDYAMRAISFLAASKKEVVSATELQNSLKIPRSFLRKILQVLNREGILISYKGKGGGFRLANPANKIFLADLIRIFQGLLSLNECILAKKVCPNVRTCILKKELDGIERYVILRLKSISIASLLT